jgi:hypothetical protein
MQRMKIAVLVVSCDKYSDIWNLFFKKFNEYWPDCPYKIYLGTNFLKCDNANVETINIGDDVSYSDNLIKMMDQIESDYIIMWVDDLMLTSSVKTNQLREIVDYSIQQNLDFVKLLPNFPYSYIEEKHGIGRLPNGIKYQVTIGISIIKKSFMKTVTSGGKTAWELEYDIARNIINDTSFKIYALSSRIKSYPISFINLLGRGKVIRNSVAYAINNGEKNLVDKRGIQPVKDYIYYRSYLLLLWAFKKLNMHWKT